MSEEQSPESTPPKPSITPAAKPKFKVTQSPFTPRIRHSINPEKPKAAPEMPKAVTGDSLKPQGVKPASLTPADHKVEPSAGKHIPGTAHAPHKPMSAPQIKPVEASEPIAEEEEYEQEEENDTSFIDMVQVGLQGVAAIAAIAFTALAVMELYPFL